MERSKNEAEAYANDVIPRARGEAEKILQAAEAYKKEVVAKAEGEASRFTAIFNEYKNAKQVTQERMYLETMEKVLADIDKVIIEKNAGSGVVPYLPLPELNKTIESELNGLMRKKGKRKKKSKGSISRSKSPPKKKKKDDEIRRNDHPEGNGT